MDGGTRSRRFDRLAAAVCHPLRAGLLLLGVYVLLSLGMSPGGYLGTDTGAKVATLEVMTERGTADPVLGYWAEEWDPNGELHPIYGSEHVDGDWVHVTTLPMLELARPLYAVGGYRLTLLLPMLGAIGAAFAARSLARRTADDDAGWMAFWTTGLLSPLVVYALDFWEQAPGVGLMLGAIALLAGITDGERHVARALGAGALLGVAATMRTEAFVYTAVAVGLCSLVLLVHRREAWRAVVVGVLAFVGFAGPWLANRALEAALGGNSRSARVSGTAGGGIGNLDDRAREAAITLFALRPAELSEVITLGGLFAALVAAAIVLSRRSEPRVIVLLLGLAALLQLSALSGGLGFVPGMVAATPLVLLPVLIPPDRVSGRFALGVAGAALPIVWAFQFVGGANPQWAGRYALASCAVLVALGAARLSAGPPVLRVGLLALTGAVALSGVLWLGERSHVFDRLFDELVERPEDVVIARNGFFIREGGAAYVERHWLTAVDDEALERAVEVVEESGGTTFAVLDEDESAPNDLHGAALVGTDRTTVTGVALYLHSYELGGS
jgi:hypothetical protein